MSHDWLIWFARRIRIKAEVRSQRLLLLLSHITESAGSRNDITQHESLEAMRKYLEEKKRKKEVRKNDCYPIRHKNLSRQKKARTP